MTATAKKTPKLTADQRSLIQMAQRLQERVDAGTRARVERDQVLRDLAALGTTPADVYDAKLPKRGGAALSPDKVRQVMSDALKGRR